MAATATATGDALARRALCAVALATAVLAAAAWGLAHAFDLGDAYALKALAAFALGAALLAPLLPGHRPFDRIGPANVVTLFRALLAALLAGFLGAGHAGELVPVILALAILALALDGLDGWLARRSRMASAFGARFDMETDAVLLLVLCALAWQLGKAGPWILAAGLLRYAFIAASWLLPWMRRPLPPALRRKTVCVVQIVALLVVLAPFVRSPASDVLAAASAALLAWSFAVDVRWLARERVSPPGRPEGGCMARSARGMARSARPVR